MCWQGCTLPLSLISKQQLFEQMNAIQIISHLNTQEPFSVNDLSFIIPHTAHTKLLESIKLVSCEGSDFLISGVMGRGDQYAVATNTKNRNSL